MNQHQVTEPREPHPPSPGDDSYEDYVPHYFTDLRPIKRLAPFSNMSCVFLMHARNRNENVILKMPAGMRMAQAPQFDWIQHEIAVLRTFQHAFAPVLLRDGTDKYGLPWFTLRFIDGPRLDRLIGDLTVKRSLELVLEWCDVVGALHQEGFVHRDVKPENVMFAQDRHIRLIDFGIAGPPGDSLQASGAGTRPYAPPEQGTKRECYGTDVYAIGVLLYELVNNRRVSPVDATEGSPPRHSQLRSRLRNRWYETIKRPLLSYIILRSLHQDPKRRYVDASHLGRALLTYVQIRSFRHVWTVLALLTVCLGLIL